MKKRIWIIVLIACILDFNFILIEINGVQAFQLVTSQEAYDMINIGEATIIDVRTLEEYVFVGSPALVAGGDPVAYLIPWEHLEGVDDNGDKIYKINPDFDALVENTFGYDKDQALIIICRSGNRSTYAAERMEQIGFTNVYEVDNKIKETTSYPGGRGGFQGSTYQCSLNGYRGYPGRFTCSEHGSVFCTSIKVATVTSDIDNPEHSVAWMDTGLPMTQEVDINKIPKLERESSSQITNHNSNTYNNYTTTSFGSPFMNYLLPSNGNFQQGLSNGVLLSQIGYRFGNGLLFPFFQTSPLYQTNALFSSTYLGTNFSIPQNLNSISCPTNYSGRSSTSSGSS